MRSISNLLALLIVIGIVIGIAVSVALITGSITQRVKPSGSSLIIQKVRAYALTSDNRYLLVEIVATVTGVQSVRITTVYLMWDTGSGVTSVSTTPQSPSTSVYLSPGSNVEIVAQFSGIASPPGNYQPVKVIVEYCNAAGQCSRAIGSGIVEPYNP